MTADSASLIAGISPIEAPAVSDYTCKRSIVYTCKRYSQYPDAIDKKWPGSKQHGATSAQPQLALLSAIAHGRAVLILKLTRARFGPLPERVQQHINEASIEELEAVGERLLDANTLQEALGPR